MEVDAEVLQGKNWKDGEGRKEKVLRHYTHLVNGRPSRFICPTRIRSMFNRAAFPLRYWTFSTTAYDAWNCRRKGVLFTVLFSAMTDAFRPASGTTPILRLSSVHPPAGIPAMSGAKLTSWLILPSISAVWSSFGPRFLGMVGIWLRRREYSLGTLVVRDFISKSSSIEMTRTSWVCGENVLSSASYVS